MSSVAVIHTGVNSASTLSRSVCSRVAPTACLGLVGVDWSSFMMILPSSVTRLSARRISSGRAANSSSNASGSAEPEPLASAGALCAASGVPPAETAISREQTRERSPPRLLRRRRTFALVQFAFMHDGR